MSTGMDWAAKWPGTPGYYAIGSNEGRQVGAGMKFRHAMSLLESFRGIATNLRNASERIARMASEIEGHKPDESLRKKESP